MAARRVEALTPPTVVLPPEPPDAGIVGVADRNLDGFSGSPKVSASDDPDNGPGAGSQILAAELRFDGAVREDGNLAIALMAQPAPGVHRDAQDRA